MIRMAATTGSAGLGASAAGVTSVGGTISDGDASSPVRGGCCDIARRYRPGRDRIFRLFDRRGDGCLCRGDLRCGGSVFPLPIPKPADSAGDNNSKHKSATQRYLRGRFTSVSCRLTCGKAARLR